MSSETVYGRLESANQLIVDAQALAAESGIQTRTFTEAADAIARVELCEADSLLYAIEKNVQQPKMIGHIRDARQLVVGLQEEWSQ